MGYGATGYAFADTNLSGGGDGWAGRVAGAGASVGGGAVAVDGDAAAGGGDGGERSGDTGEGVEFGVACLVGFGEGEGEGAAGGQWDGR